MEFQARDGHLIPQPLQTEVTVKVPPPITQLAEDLHKDRETIGLGAAILIGCVVASTLKRLFQ